MADGTRPPVDLDPTSLLRLPSILADVTEVVGKVLVVMIVLAIVIGDLVVAGSDAVPNGARVTVMLLSLPAGVVLVMLTSFWWLVLGRFLRLQERRDDQLRQLLALVTELPTRRDLGELPRALPAERDQVRDEAREQG